MSFGDIGFRVNGFPMPDSGSDVVLSGRLLYLVVPED